MQETISVLIIEDEIIWAKRLEESLRSLGFTVAAVFNNATDTIQQAASLAFDIALIDIRINGEPIGIELGRIIHEIHKKPIIFITGNIENELSPAVLLAKPSAYLLKPVNDQSLFVAIQTALDNFNSHKIASSTSSKMYDSESFFIKSGSKYVKIEWKNILFLKTDGRYTRVYLINDLRDYLLGTTLIKTINTIIPNNYKNLFIQINRSEVVNLNHIKELKKDNLVTDTKSFKVSENYIKELKERINIIT